MIRSTLLANLALVGLGATASAQWVETVHSDTQTNYPSTFINSWTANNNQTYHWSVLTPNWFIVIGSSNTAPNWRPRFASLAYNTWNEKEDFSEALTVGQVVSNYYAHYTKIGTNTFSWAGFPEQPDETRQLDEKVTTSIWRVLS